MKRLLIAGLVGGIVVFVWGAISHMLLPLGEAGISEMPNEESVVGAMKQSLGAPGLYFFPGMGGARPLTPEQQKAWEAKIKAGPTGILVYQPAGSEPLSARQLGIELLTNVLAAWVAALVVVRVRGTLAHRAGLVALLGLFAWLSLSVSYWNWYGFPTAFILAEGVDQVVGWFLGGIPIAALARPGSGT